MIVLEARNVHEVLPLALEMIHRDGYLRDSRNGKVLQAPGPVTTVLLRPTERVMFWPERDANPFFHFMESLWMLAGQDDVKFVTRYVKTMINFSDDGTRFWGAYGRRWRSWFKFDQVDEVIRALDKNPDDRRCVISMWDPRKDLLRGQAPGTKDVPCNTIIHLGISPLGMLEMQVNNRSNDLVWGAHGANAVHFSFLQEYIALSLGVPVGRMFQNSFNYHGYLSTVEPLIHLRERAGARSPYAEGEGFEHIPLFDRPSDRKDFDFDLQVFMAKGPIVGFSTEFFRRVVTPIEYAWRAWKKEGDVVDRHAAAVTILEQCVAQDWRFACTEWLDRRLANARAQA